MTKNIKIVLILIGVVLTLLFVFQFVMSSYKLDNAEKKTTVSTITRKELKPPGLYPQHSWVGKTMHTTNVHKGRDFLIHVSIDSKEASFSVTEEAYNKYKIKDTVNVVFVDAGIFRGNVVLGVTIE
ncbi:hypothetical protein QSV08_09725 [Maribacter sp. BPC-D8]|uniref:hypothetical protein n=1 Tax=Maribacter sp. BPC-D8 TaxID=3053613 RepID=UPI002B461AB3|nr:hypothetical protein [Maribacter sp. BPC-D8]WRI31514.1 hypothetical protein QSV08_09725 [Maribacter sp. BPC-D8]